MTYLLLDHSRDTLVATDRRIVKAPERAALNTALELLATVRERAATQAAEAEQVRKDARREGYDAGFADGRRAFAEAIARLSAQAVEHHRAEEAEIAQLALAALRHMVATIGDAAIMEGIARRAVAAVMPAETVLVETSEAMLDGVSAALADLDGGDRVTVRADPEFGDRQCRVTAADGRIIADLDVQIAALEERWGTANVG